MKASNLSDLLSAMGRKRILIMAPRVSTAGNPGIHAEKDQMLCVADWWSSREKLELQVN